MKWEKQMKAIWKANVSEKMAKNENENINMYVMAAIINVCNQ